MATLAQINLLDGLFTMMKGEPGTRKSTCALSYPRKQYWFSTDKKMAALQLPAKRWGIKLHEIEYDDYASWDPMLSKLESLQVNCPYKSIVVDSITSTGDAMTSQVRKLKQKDGQGKTIGGITVSGFEEFNAEAGGFSELISKLQDIQLFHKVNIIIIAHVIGQRKDNDSNKLTHHSRIIVTGSDKIGAKIASYVTEAYHFNIESDFNVDSGEGKYSILTSHTGNDYARTSLPLPRKIIFNDEPLYDKYILPAMKKQMETQPTVRIENSPTTVKPTAVDGFDVK